MISIMKWVMLGISVRIRWKTNERQVIIMVTLPVVAVIAFPMFGCILGIFITALVSVSHDDRP